MREPSSTGPAAASEIALPGLPAVARRRPLRLAGAGAVGTTAVLGAVLALAGAAVTARSPYHDQPAADALASAALVASMAAIACIGLYRGTEDRVGLIWTALGVVAATRLDSSSDPVLDAVGQVAWAALVVLAVYILLTLPEGRLAGRVSRALVAGAAAATAATWGALLATADRLPAFSATARCAEACPRNPARIIPGSGGLTDALGVATSGVTAVALAAVTVVLACRLRRAGAIRRRTLAPIVVAVTTVAIAMTAATVLRAAGEDAHVDRLSWIVFAAALGVPLAFAIGMLGGRVFAGRALQRLVTRLSMSGTDARDVRGVLADALGDPTLSLGFWRSNAGGYVDASGRPMQMPSPGRGRAATVVRRDDQPVAVIVHDRALGAEPDLVAAAGSAALVTLEIHRLEADLRAAISDLVSSRARLASAADAGRRQIERDLHDGAQERLVTLRAKLAQAQARASADREMHRALDELLADADATIDELRGLAHGVYPALLIEHGLVAALASVADSSPGEVRLVAPALRRLSPEVEATVYFCCLEAIQNAAKHAGSGATVTVELQAQGKTVAFAVSDDGVGFDVDRALSGDGLTSLLDRVAAAGGQLEVSSAPGHGTTVRGELPAAS